MLDWADELELCGRGPYLDIDHALPMSDHADFADLLELVERVRPKKVYSHHGYREFADTLRARGYDAELARPDEQLRLSG